MESEASSQIISIFKGSWFPVLRNIRRRGRRGGKHFCTQAAAEAVGTSAEVGLEIAISWGTQKASYRDAEF